MADAEKPDQTVAVVKAGSHLDRLRWEAARRHGAPVSRSVQEWSGLYRRRLQPRGATDPGVWWKVTDDESARHAVSDMTAQLEAEGWPLLEALFSRDAMRAQVQRGDLGYLKRPGNDVFFARAGALLLMDDGPSGELDAHLEEALARTMPSQHENALQFDSWVRSQAATRAVG